MKRQEGINAKVEGKARKAWEALDLDRLIQSEQDHRRIQLTNVPHCLFEQLRPDASWFAPRSRINVFKTPTFISAALHVSNIPFQLQLLLKALVDNHPVCPAHLLQSVLFKIVSSVFVYVDYSLTKITQPVPGPSACQR